MQSLNKADLRASYIFSLKYHHLVRQCRLFYLASHGLFKLAFCIAGEGAPNFPLATFLQQRILTSTLTKLLLEAIKLK